MINAQPFGIYQRVWFTIFGKENVYEDKTFVIFYSCDFFGRM